MSVGLLPIQPLAALGAGMASTDSGTSLSDSQQMNAMKIPVVGPIISSARGVYQGAKAVGKLAALFSDPIFIVTLVLGFLLIAAGIFTHPVIREKVVSAGKAAGKAAALAA